MVKLLGYKVITTLSAVIVIIVLFCNSGCYKLQLGPNVSIGPGVVVGRGVRIRESIILNDAFIGDRSLVLHSIVGRNSRIGTWARVEGTPSDPDPNKNFAKMENPPLFNSDGRLNPSITILGGYFGVVMASSVC